MQLADFIVSNIEPILMEWEAFARSIWPSAAATDPAILRDDAEDLLRATAADMNSDQTATQQSDKSRGKGGGGSQSGRIDRASDAHVGERHSSGFNLAAVISEYRALRASVVRLWRERSPQPTANDLDDLTRFNESIDQSLIEAVVAFTKLVEQERQAALVQQTRLASELREMNEALLISSVEQHELREQTAKDKETIAASERELSDFFETASIGLHWVGPDGIILRANQAELDLLGYGHAGGRDEYVGRHIAEFHADQPVIDEILARLLRGESLRDYPARLRCKDGSLRDVLINSSAFFDKGGFIHTRCFTHDITERCLLESRTREQAKDLADLHRRKDEFLAMLSHELRNPLAPIQNAVHLLRLQQDRTPLQMEAHGMIDRQVAQLTRLVDDLLEVSRITTGRIHLQEERVDLRGIVERAIEATQPQAGGKGQSVAKALPAEPTWLYGDPVRLEQVVVNLLNNASKYTDRGGHIWVGLNQEKNEAVLRVRDNGVGIAAELLPRIFDLFTQADKSLDRAQGGLGIGLALVQSLVTMHHGRVEVQSSPGQGSEFIVTLPLDLTHAPAAAAAQDMPAPSHALKVLVVDDNLDAAKGLAMLLGTFGHDTRVAHDGASAMQAALEYVPDVVLLDIGLPVVSGYEVAKWIRQEPALKNVVLVALTGYGQESDLQHAQDAGFDHHLTKPGKFAKVEAILATIADQ